MTDEARKMVDIAVELIFLGGLVLIVALAATVGRDSVNSFSEQQALRPNLVAGVELTRGTVGYYELTDIIDFYTPTTDVHVKYLKNGFEYTLTFTAAGEDGRAGDGSVRLLIYKNDTGPVQYRRASSALYRDGVALSVSSGYTLLADDMGLEPDGLKALRNIPGNGMLGYEFTQALFEWAADARFVCTVKQEYGAEDIEAITLSIIN